MKSAARILGVTAAVILFGLTLFGCGGPKTVTPVAVGQLQEYRDPLYGYHFRYPQGWIAGGEAGRTRIYSSVEAGQRFVDPLGAYPDGVMIAIDVFKTATPDQQKATLIAELKSSGRVLTAETQSTIGGKPATTIAYTANWSKQVKEAGDHIYVVLDTLLYDITLAGFGEQYSANRLIWDTTTKSFEFPKPVEKGRDQTLPSESFTDYDAKLFTFQYPDNFNFDNAIAKGNNELALGLRGVRLDCSIQFIVFGAKGLTVEKVVDQNKAKYPGAASGKATISGQPALTLTYTPAKEVERRVYFVVKGDKVYRVIMDWFKPQREQYLAAYEKVIQSIKIK
jgi:hypothetical protein